MKKVFVTVITFILLVAMFALSPSLASAKVTGGNQDPQMFIYGPGFPEMNNSDNYYLYDLDNSCWMKSAEIYVTNVNDPMDQTSYYYEANTGLLIFNLQFNSNNPYYIDALVACADGRVGSVSATLGEPFLSYVGALSTNQVPVSGFQYTSFDCMDPNLGTPVITVNVNESVSCDAYVFLGDMITGGVELSRATQLLGEPNATQYHNSTIYLSPSGDTTIDIGTFSQTGTYYVWVSLRNEYTVGKPERLVIVDVI